jgi:hypothetical protein
VTIKGYAIAAGCTTFPPEESPEGKSTGANVLQEWQSLAHVKWECKYHVVIVPKYWQKLLFGRIRGEVGKIIRQLCRQKEVDLMEGHAMPDHIKSGAERSPKIQHRNGCWISERQISYSYPPPGGGGEKRFHRKTLLVTRLLCQYNRN